MDFVINMWVCLDIPILSVGRRDMELGVKRGWEANTKPRFFEYHPSREELTVIPYGIVFWVTAL